MSDIFLHIVRAHGHLYLHAPVVATTPARTRRLDSSASSCHFMRCHLPQKVEILSDLCGCFLDYPPADTTPPLLLLRRRLL